jgi:hypothetical protein
MKETEQPQEYSNRDIYNMLEDYFISCTLTSNLAPQGELYEFHFDRMIYLFNELHHYFAEQEGDCPKFEDSTP